MKLKLPILAGPLRGRWWLPSSRGKLLRVLLGTYEPAQTAHFLARVRPGDTVFDIGAHAGYYTLLASAAVGKTGSVWAFEPEPRNREALCLHVALNGLENVRVQSFAVAERRELARFGAGGGSGTGRLDEAGPHTVETVSLDELCASRGVVPAVIKVDVEGAEARVLEGGRRLLTEHRPMIFLSTHGPEVHAQCLRMLAERDYVVRGIDAPDAAASTEVLALPREQAAAEP